MFPEIAFALVCAAAIAAAPLPRTGISALLAEQIASFRPYALFARAAYCPASRTATWSCGAACDDLPGFVPVASGGDGVVTPFWFVGYDPNLQSVVVSNQGTNPEKIIPLLVDADFRLDNLDMRLFPNVSSLVKTHNGFQEAQARSAEAKLTAVKKAMSEKGTSLVTLTGHSLGGAISLIDALYFSYNLPSATLKVVTHGAPRVGNAEFAALIDSKIKDLSRVTNEKDMVPTVPGKFLGFNHASGEKHIVAPGNWMDCVGQDNPNRVCSVGAVPTIVAGLLPDHMGPYEGIHIGGCP